MEESEGHVCEKEERGGRCEEWSTGGKQKKRWKFMEAMSFLDESTSFRRWAVSFLRNKMRLI